MNGESTAIKRFQKPYHFLNRLEKQGVLCLSEVFKNFHLDDFRRELNLWLHIALSNDQSAYDEGNTREDLIDFIAELHKLIEAFYILHKNYNRSKKNMPGKGLSKQIQRMLREMNIPILLTDEEMRKPALAIKAFCKTFPSGYTKAEILDMLDAVVTYEGNKKIYNGNLVLFYQHLYCLIKLAYQMNKTKNRKSN